MSSLNLFYQLRAAFLGMMTSVKSKSIPVSEVAIIVSGVFPVFRFDHSITTIAQQLHRKFAQSLIILNHQYRF